MHTPPESPGGILLVSALVAVGCSVIVSAAVSHLRPLQRAHESADYNRALVTAVGLIDSDQSASSAELARLVQGLDVRSYDFRESELTDKVDPFAFDYWSIGSTEHGSSPVSPDADSAKLGRRPDLLPVYILRDGDRLSRLVLPVHGQGMWSTIRGFVVVGPDLNTIDALAILSHGETPGIGDRIESPEWLASWSGKKIANESGVRIALAGNGGGANSYEIDAITGATVTVRSVVDLVRFWLGDEGYGPLLDQLKEDAGNSR